MTPQAALAVVRAAGREVRLGRTGPGDTPAVIGPAPAVAEQR